MANTNGSTVFYVDTTDATLNIKQITGVKYIGNISGTAVIKSETSSGAQIWEESGTANVFDDIKVNCTGGVHVAVTNGAAVYIYTA